MAEHLEIASEHYFTAAQGVYGPQADESALRCGGAAILAPVSMPHVGSLFQLMFCVLVTKSGQAFHGEAVAAGESPEAFELARREARRRAMTKVISLMAAGWLADSAAGPSL